MIFGVAAEIIERQKLTGSTNAALPAPVSLPSNLPDDIRQDIARRPIPPGVHRVYNKAFKMPERPRRAE